MPGKMIPRLHNQSLSTPKLVLQKAAPGGARARCAIDTNAVSGAPGAPYRDLLYQPCIAVGIVE